MKSFEPVYKELEYLLIQKLPDYIEKINKEHNDGIILKPFENTSLSENCIKTPSFILNMEETEYSEKDRIIVNTIYTISLEIKLPSNTEDEQITFWRYTETVIKMIYGEDTKYYFEVSKMKRNFLYLRVCNEYQKIFKYNFIEKTR